MVEFNMYSYLSFPLKILLFLFPQNHINEADVLLLQFSIAL